VKIVLNSSASSHFYNIFTTCSLMLNLLNYYVKVLVSVLFVTPFVAALIKALLILLYGGAG